MEKNILRLTIAFLILTALPVNPKNLKFAVVPKYYSLFFDESGNGCKDLAAQIEGVECIYRGPEKGDVRLQDKIIEQLINEGVDGIAVAVTESNFLARSSLQKARNAGIPIVTYDSDFDEPTLEKYGDLRLAYIGTDNFELGRALGQQLKKLRPEGGTLLIQTGRPDSANLNLRIMGLRSALSGKTYQDSPGKILQNDLGWTEVRSPIPNYDNINRSVKQLESVLRVKPNRVDAFVAVGGWPQNNEGQYRKMIEPFQDKLDNKEIVLVISDASDIQLRMLGDHLAHVNIGQSPYEMGRQIISTLLKIVEKQNYEKVIYTPLRYCTPVNYVTCSK
ncbi:substrate-binding domain-containing protein [Psychromonas antarctica]|uniref:substrate-binding domain-containing protein n=1 Tax=Psychromonas antarctica TaxID=67573 RepID=UPI001EE84F47|nr:substrate-binding domain-containing protein [Psychromonas antarctica]MCG6201985.1 substrate-binding domain-containing protein [Psychromonas antarctica]